MIVVKHGAHVPSTLRAREPAKTARDNKELAFEARDKGSLLDGHRDSTCAVMPHTGTPCASYAVTHKLRYLAHADWNSGNSPLGAALLSTDCTPSTGTCHRKRSTKRQRESRMLKREAS